VSVLGPLEVIWIYDECISPPGPKMVVCVEATLGLFFRINSRASWQQSLPLKKGVDHPFLDHDSFLECGDPLELDDYVIDESLRQKGVIGTLSQALIPDILQAVHAATRVTEKDKQTITAFLDPKGVHQQARASTTD
jgi:hypothetical protein